MHLFALGLSVLACTDPKESGEAADRSDDVEVDMDADRDGVSAAAGDCNDSDPNISPSATDLVGDAIDQNCDGVDGTDFDGDGYPSIASGGTDCDDDDDLVNPSVPEIPYDGIDNDCANGDVLDVDGDGYAGGATGDDCDDSDAAVSPGATDEPYDGIDADCSGNDDYDADGDGVPVWEDCDDEDPLMYPGAAALEPTVCTVDADGDGYGDFNVNGGSDCDDVDGTRWEVGPSGNYYGTAIRRAGGWAFDWSCVVSGLTWSCTIGDPGDDGTFDEHGIVDSYTRVGDTEATSATGSLCGGVFELGLSWSPSYGDGLDWVGYVAE